MSDLNLENSQTRPSPFWVKNLFHWPVTLGMALLGIGVAALFLFIPYLGGAVIVANIVSLLIVIGYLFLGAFIGGLLGALISYGYGRYKRATHPFSILPSLNQQRTGAFFHEPEVDSVTVISAVDEVKNPGHLSQLYLGSEIPAAPSDTKAIHLKRRSEEVPQPMPILEQADIPQDPFSGLSAAIAEEDWEEASTYLQALKESEQKALWSQTDKDGNTLLMQAVLKAGLREEKESLEFVTDLLGKMNTEALLIVNDQKQNFLHLACAVSEAVAAPCFQYLKDLMALPIKAMTALLDQQTVIGNTPSMFASSAQLLSLRQARSDLVFDVSLENVCGYTLLHHAVKEKNLSLLKILLDQDAEQVQDALETDYEYNQETVYGCKRLPFTPLGYAEYLHAQRNEPVLKEIVQCLQAKQKALSQLERFPSLF